MSGWQKCILVICAVLLLAMAGLTVHAALNLPRDGGHAGTAIGADSDAAPDDIAADGFVLNDAPQLRVLCGELQWFDGARWTALGSLDALRGQDVFHQQEAADAASAAGGQTADTADAADGEAENVINARAGEAADAAPAMHHNRAEGTVPRSSGSGGSGGSGGGGGGSSGGGGGGPEWSGDYE